MIMPVVASSVSSSQSDGRGTCTEQTHPSPPNKNNYTRKHTRTPLTSRGKKLTGQRPTARRRTKRSQVRAYDDAEVANPPFNAFGHARPQPERQMRQARQAARLGQSWPHHLALFGANELCVCACRGQKSATKMRQWKGDMETQLAIFNWGNHKALTTALK